MTTRYTDQEWSSIIAATEKVVRPAITHVPKAIPSVDDPAFAQTIDHTLLKLEATKAQIDDLCSEARVAGFATVCVRPNFTQQAVNNVKGSTVRVAVVIGFHSGENDLAEKLAETSHAVTHGALELDVVINRTHLQAREYEKVYNELAAIRSVAPHPVLLKLILETSQLDHAQIIAAAVLARAASFDFIKTSTGFHGHGATEEHVRLMSACCEVLGEAAVGGWAGHGLLAEYKSLVTEAGVAVEAPAPPVDGNGPPRTKTLVHKMQVKASGGIRTLDDAVKMLKAGATRLGTSGGVWIMKEARETADIGPVRTTNRNPSDYVRRSHRHRRHDSGHHSIGHSRTNSKDSKPQSRPQPAYHEAMKDVASKSTRKVQPNSHDPHLRHPFAISVKDFAHPSSTTCPGTSSPQSSTTLPTRPANSRHHQRNARDGSAPVINPNAYSGSTLQVPLMDTRSPPSSRLPLSTPTDENWPLPLPSTPRLATQPRHIRRVGSADIAVPVPWEQLPAALRHQVRMQPDISKRERHTDGSPSPPRTSLLHVRGPARSILESRPLSTPREPPTRERTRGDKSFHGRPCSTTTTSALSSSATTRMASTKTICRKIALPGHYPGGETVEILVLGDDAQGMWQGNGVVMTDPTTPCHKAGRRVTEGDAPVANRKGRETGVHSIDKGSARRPGLSTRLYTDF